MDLILQKIAPDFERAAAQVRAWQAEGQKVVFTNGCFDLIHRGHLHYLAEAKDLGQRLVIGLNSDASVARLKGPHRPIKPEYDRSLLLASLSFVDLVILFEEDTPLRCIQALLPDVLVKGGDWQPAQIVGSAEVLAKGGQVRSLQFIPGFSTSALEAKIKNS